MMMDAPAAWLPLLEALGRRVRDQIAAGRNDSDHDVVGREGGDTIFAIDRRVEPLIVEALGEAPGALLPILVVCEGLGSDGRRRFGPLGLPLRYRVLIDPIDGTRSLMYDKRSAWFLAAAAPDRGEETSLSDTLAAVMVELPTSKQGRADVFTWNGDRTVGWRDDLTGTGASRPISFKPSEAPHLRHGFGQVASFFPGTKRLAADLMERIAERMLDKVSIAEASIFEDQYICTGGQLVELMCGRDRFCCDLRPIFYKIQAKSGGEARGLCCHPYDMAPLNLVRAAGVIVTDGYGRALDAPFDVQSDVHWCGYANEELRRAIEPVIQEWIAERLDPSDR